MASGAVVPLPVPRLCCAVPYMQIVSDEGAVLVNSGPSRADAFYLAVYRKPRAAHFRYCMKIGFIPDA